MDKIIDCIFRLDKITNDYKKSFECILNYFGYKLHIENCICKGTKEIFDILQSINVEDYINDSCEDIFGQIYEKLYKQQLDKVIDNIHDQVTTTTNDIYTIYIKNAQTGRAMLELFKKNKNLFFFCDESNSIFYKILLINSKLYKIRSRILFTELQIKGNNSKILPFSKFDSDNCNKWI